MTEHLSYTTKFANLDNENRKTCSFFTKMGACRHGETCDGKHHRPSRSPTILFANMYNSPPATIPGPYGEVMTSEAEMEEAFESFYIDAFVEASKFGAIEEMNVCANPGQHLNGNVYVKFSNEEQASKALEALNGRQYDGKPLKGELCLVTNFSDARCKSYRGGMCDRKMCNFLHLKEPPQKLSKQLFAWQLENWKKHRQYERPPPQYFSSHPSSGYSRGGDDDSDRRGYHKPPPRRDDRYDRGGRDFDHRDFGGGRRGGYGEHRRDDRGVFDDDGDSRGGRYESGGRNRRRYERSPSPTGHRGGRSSSYSHSHNDSDDMNVGEHHHHGRQSHSEEKDVFGRDSRSSKPSHSHQHSSSTSQFDEDSKEQELLRQLEQVRRAKTQLEHQQLHGGDHHAYSQSKVPDFNTDNYQLQEHGRGGRKREAPEDFGDTFQGAPPSQRIKPPSTN